MSWYTPEQKRESIARARALLAETAPSVQPEYVSRSSGPALVRKTRDEALVTDDVRPISAPAESSEIPPRGWVEAYTREIAEATVELISRRVDPIKRELEQQRRELTVSLREQVLECGRALREEAKAASEQGEHERDLLIRELSALREQVGAEREFKAREIEQLRCAVDLHAEYLLGVKELRDQVARAKDAQAQAGEELLRRELAVLQKEIGLERAVRALHDEVEVAKSEIPQVPAIEARVTAELAAHKTETERLEAQLKTTKDRLSNLRDYTLTQMERKQAKRATPEPAIEIKLETSATQFVMRDIDPAAMDAWRNFVAGMLQAQQDAETTLSITRATGAAGQVVALPVRKNGNAA